MRSFLNKHKQSTAIKISVFFISLFVCFGLLELGLRAAGFAIEATRQKVFIPPYDDERFDADDMFERYKPASTPKRLILTFGDSLTNGGNVKSYHSYPYYLYQQFSNSGVRAAIYNLGKCEESTFGVAHKFKQYLESAQDGERPDTAVILVGAADLFNLPLVRERKRGEGGFWRDVLPGSWFYRLRLYKVYRHITMQLTLKKNLRNDLSNGSAEEKFEILLKTYREHKEEIKGDVKRPLSPRLVSRLMPIFGDEARRYDLELRAAGDFMELLADYAGRVYSTRSAYDEFFSLLLDIAETFPYAFWTDFFDAANYHFVQTYQVQSKYTAEDVLRTLNKSSKKHPELSRNEGFRSFKKLLTDREEMNRYIDRKRMDAWGEIVALSQEYKVRLVLLNYPVEYKSANRALAKVAEKYGLPLVDNQAAFGKMIHKRGRAPFLEDNDHLTPAGNKILAGNVFSAVKTSTYGSTQDTPADPALH
jgi:lysophospholipase L1-like esterase